MKIKELLDNYARIMDELISIGVIRTYNNPVSDYAECLIAQNLHLILAPSSQKGYDAIDKKNLKYQIKSRRNRSKGTVNQLGVIRNLNENHFDYLIAVIFNHDFSLDKVWKIPSSIISKYSRFSKHQNGYILNLNSGILKDIKVVNMTKNIKLLY